MVNKITNIILPLFSFLLFNFVKSFDLTTTPCTPAYHQQSPINIDTSLAKYREELYFRILSSNFTKLNTTWEVFPNEQTIGFSGDMGYLIFVKNWSMQKFLLKNIYFRYNSGHKIDGQQFDVEMELIFNIDTTYRPPGRYISPEADTLIISIFFVVSDKLGEEKSLLFNYTNLDNFSVNPSSSHVRFVRPIRLNNIIQHQPGYFYLGATTSSSCDPAYRVIYPKYQVIPSDQYKKLGSILTTLGFINPSMGITSNARKVEPINAGVEILTNDADSTRLLIESHEQQYDVTKSIHIDLFIFVLLIIGLFC